MLAPQDEPGVGPTGALRLRVSAAALVRLVFAHPRTGQVMLALEQKASLRAGGRATFTAQPFGGSVRILQPGALARAAAGFHYDSPQSKAEQDFRILIRPADWPALKQFCLDQFRAPAPAVLENDPARELHEELADALQVDLDPRQYRLRPLGLLVENHPVKTANLRAARLPTARIYTVFEASLLDGDLIERLLGSSVARAVEEARRGGKGRASAALALPLDRLVAAYLALPPAMLSRPLYFDGNRLESSVTAVLEEVPAPRYERIAA